MGWGGKRCDMVLMNLLFGVWRGGVDVAFFRAAFKIVDGVIYSLYKMLMRVYIEKVVKIRFYVCEVEVLV